MSKNEVRSIYCGLRIQKSHTDPTSSAYATLILPAYIIIAADHPERIS